MKKIKFLIIIAIFLFVISLNMYFSVDIVYGKKQDTEPFFQSRINRASDKLSSEIISVKSRLIRDTFGQTALFCNTGFFIDCIPSFFNGQYVSNYPSWDKIDIAVEKQTKPSLN